MKKIYLLCITGIMMLASCSDFLESNSSSSLIDTESIKSVKDLRMAVRGAYSIHAGQQVDDLPGFFGTYSSDFGIYADLLGGDFESKKSVNQIAPVGRYSVDPAHSLTENFYFKFYVALARTNAVLAVIDDVPLSEDPGVAKKEEVEVKDLKGQLYAYRALLHFDVARLYAKLPSTVADINAANSGIVLSTEVYPAEHIGTRATLKETYDQILGDLEKALPLLGKGKNLGAINYWAAKGIQARAYLYLEKNAEALVAAKEVIEGKRYTLYSISDYQDVWLQEGSSESMFEMLVTSAYNAQRNSLGYYTHGDNGYAECGLTRPFVNFMATQAGDVRATMFGEESDFNFYPTKYNGREGNRYVNNPKIIRLSEVYLIAAEAALKSTTGQEAAIYINELRKNRIKNYVDVASVNLDDILTERRLELFCEGHNAFDYWRNKQSVHNTSVGEVKYDDKRTILPIPNREITLSQGKLVQNPF